MANPFENIRAKAGEEQRSYNWYMNSVRKFASNVDTFGSAAENNLGQVGIGLQPGSMYMFAYDPKYKKTLPYYDRFPLLMPFEITKNGFVGLNLHYLPPMMRAKLLGSLLDFSDKTITTTSKIHVQWQTLQNFARFPGIQPTIKRYLIGHVKSRFLKVDPVNWKSAIFLPTQRFVGASNRTVYRHSKEIANG